MKTSPKDFFLHLAVIASLYTIAVSFINLAWRIIDYVFPSGNFYGYYERTLSAPVATLIVVFPIFIILYWLLNREYQKIPEKRNLWIRKWLVYITLFLSGIVIVVDLIVVLISFLGGELLTVGFVLKALAVFIVALAIFGYYIVDLRGQTTSKINKISAWASGLIILILIISGFSILGSPRTQRLLRIDEQKIGDLQNIQWQVVNFWQNKGEVPKTLADLSDPISGFIAPRDPQSGEAYGYRVLSAPLTFELCANFNLESRPVYRGTASPDIRGFDLPKPITPQDSWNHPAGNHCFERTIDPELYPHTKR